MLVSLLFAACATPTPPRGIVIVANDTVRWDRAGLDGTEGGRMPNLVAFSRLPGAVTLTHAYAGATFSHASYASLFTGRDAALHGAGFGGQRLGDDASTLAEALSAYGWRTAAFTGGGQVIRPSGLAQGFETWREAPVLAPLAKQVDPALQWLDERIAAGEPFFLFVHGYDAHTPYESPLEELYDPDYQGNLHASPRADTMQALRTIDQGFLSPEAGSPLALDDADLDHVRAHYDAAVRYADHHTGRLLRALDERGVLDTSVVVVLSDHGEELGEHGHFGHGPFLREETMRVPVVVRFPDLPGPARRHESLTSLVDLAPTLLAWMGASPLGEADGRDILEALRGGPAPEERPARFASGCCFGVRSREWLLSLDLPPPDQPIVLLPALYADGAGDDVAAAHPDVVAALRTELAGWPPSPADVADPTRGPSEELVHAVRKAGYWQGPAGDVKAAP